MPFIYHRTVRFKDTDAAGVVYFANTLTMCHEAYEASLAASGIEVGQFFRQGPYIIPIIHAEADYFRPAQCGDRQEIHLHPIQMTAHQFSIDYKIYKTEDLAHPIGQAQTQHLCIRSADRQRQSLPPDVMKWIETWGNLDKSRRQ